MPAWPMGSLHRRMKSGVACHHRHWVAHTVRRRRAWHAIIALGLDTLLDYVRRGMPSWTLTNTHGRPKSSIARHHLLWTIHAIEQCHTWHAFMALGMHTWSEDVGCGMPSSLLGNTCSRTMLGVTCRLRLRQYTWRDDVGRGMTLSPLT